jgi:hypothetical protein
MQIDMHYYDVYMLARAAGLRPPVAEDIAASLHRHFVLRELLPQHGVVVV